MSIAISIERFTSSERTSQCGGCRRDATVCSVRRTEHSHTVTNGV